MNVSGSAMSDFLIEHAKGFGSLFYIVNPYESMFENEEDIPKPNWTEKASPYFFILIVLEQIILKLKRKEGIRLNDGLTSLILGMMMMMTEVLLKGVGFSVYAYVWEHYRVWEMQWNSAWTWIVAALFYDLGYYWVHRAAHELNVLWAAHQVHHSSEDYNLTTALRQSMFQKFGSWPFYIPMAFFIPPTHTIVHAHLNLIYQFWIHTEVVKDMGPLEYILNTPKHHRVHHGSNRYCLDKNYAGVLIIWDRIFGTFEAERSDEDLVYGLVDQPQFFNPLKHQLFYYGKIVEKMQSMSTMKDKLYCLIKGPGWFPGTERLGDLMQVPERQDRIKFGPKFGLWLNLYCLVQFLAGFMIYDAILRSSRDSSSFTIGQMSIFASYTLISIGLIFEKHRWCWHTEWQRIVVFFAFHFVFSTWENLIIPSNFLCIFYFLTLLFALAMLFSSKTESNLEDKRKEEKKSSKKSNVKKVQ